MPTSISTAIVSHIAKLANIPVTTQEETSIAGAFTATLAVIEQLRQLDVSQVPPTHHMTDLSNVWREDAVVEEWSFSQDAALANATRTHQGYFVVPRVLEEK